MIGLIVAILRFLFGVSPEGRAEVQLVPVRSHRAARLGKAARSVRYFWVPGVGWYVLDSELRQCDAVFKWLFAKRFLAFSTTGGGRSRRAIRRT